jgi:hypothetical protein
LIHHRVAAAADDLGTRDRAIAGDANLDRADERFVLLENRGGLLPLAEKPVVDEIVIPAEFRRGASAAGFRCIAG